MAHKFLFLVLKSMFQHINCLFIRMLKRIEKLVIDMCFFQYYEAFYNMLNDF